MKINGAFLSAATAALVIFVGFQALSQAQPPAQRDAAGGFVAPRRMKVAVLWGDPAKPFCATTLFMDEGASAKNRQPSVNNYFAYTLRVRGSVNPDGTITLDIDSETISTTGETERLSQEIGTSITVQPGVETVIREAPRVVVTATLE